MGIIGEPYLDTDFSQVFYLTDTGRRWDGYKVSVRDKIEKWQDEWVKEGLVFHTTDDVISAAMCGRMQGTMTMSGRRPVAGKGKEDGMDGGAVGGGVTRRNGAEDGGPVGVRLPDKVMITTHPQRWTDSFGRWLWELTMQEGKNVVKGWKVKRGR